MAAGETFSDLEARSKQLEQQTNQLRAQIREAEKLGQSTEELRKELEKVTQESEGLTQSLKDVQKEWKPILDSIKQADTQLSGINGLQRNLVGLERQRLLLSRNLLAENSQLSEKFSNLRESISELSALSSDDIAARETLLQKIKDQRSEINAISETEKVILENLNEQQRRAEIMSGINSDAQKKLEDQLKVYTDTLTTYRELTGLTKFYFTNIGTAVGGAIMAFGSLLDKMSKINKSFGTSIFSMNEFTLSAGVLSTVFENAETTARGLTEALGNTSKVTKELQLNANLLGSNLGLSGEETSKLIGQFGQLNGQSSEHALNMISSVRSASRLGGVLPNDVAKDLAEATEEMAKYTDSTGDNMLRAAVQARQFGLSIKQTTQVADKLLNFEDSIASELEASAMLGRDLNFQRARELAYLGDTEGMMGEIASQLGSIEEFNNMDVFTKQKVADSLGLQVAELQKIMANQENINTVGGQIGKQYSLIAEGANFIANEWGSGIVGGIGGAITNAAAFGKEVKNIRDRMEGATSVWEKVKGFFGFGGGAIPASTTLTTQAPGIPGGAPVGPTQMQGVGGTGSPVDQAGKLGEATSKLPSAGQLLSIAVVMIAFAGAIYILSKAFQEFDKLENLGTTLTAFGTAIVGMSVALWAAGKFLTMAAPELLAAAAVLVAVGVGITAIGYGIKLATEGLASLVEAFKGLDVSAASNMLAFAASIGILSASVWALSAAGLAALPVLAGLAVAGGVVGSLGLFGGGEGEGKEGKEGEGKASLDSVVKAIDKLRDELMNKQIVVNLDTKPIYKGVAYQNAKDPVTKTQR